MATNQEKMAALRASRKQVKSTKKARRRAIRSRMFILWPL